MGHFIIYKVNPDTGPIATDEEMHRYLESMNFRIAWEEHEVCNGQRVSHNIVLYFDPFPLKYLNYVKRFGYNINQEKHKKRSGHFPARSIKVGLMVEKNNWHIPKLDTADYNMDGESLLELVGLWGAVPFSQSNIDSPAQDKRLIKLLTKRYYKINFRELDPKIKPKVRANSKDAYYVPHGGVYDYGDYHVKMYSKREPANIMEDGTIMCNPVWHKAKYTPRKSNSKPGITGRNFMNKAFYMNLSVTDAARGFVVFPDVDRAVAKGTDCVYACIKDNLVESIIGYIDHLESVQYDDGNDVIRCLPKILTENKLTGPQHISHLNEIKKYMIEQYYLINR